MDQDIAVMPWAGNIRNRLPSVVFRTFLGAIALLVVVAPTQTWAQRYVAPPPEIPFRIRKDRHGTALLRLTFTRNGTPEKVELARSCGHALIDAELVRWAKSFWRAEGLNPKVFPKTITVPISF